MATPETALTPMTGAEHDMLMACETVIETDQAAFIRVGTALVTIREQRLYRDSYTDFKTYCLERWNFGASHAYRLIAAADVVENVPEIQSERAARELVGLEPDVQRAVHTIAADLAGDQPVTAKLLQQVREGVENEVRDILQATLTDPSDGEVKPLSVMMRANVTKSVYEDLQQNKERIRSIMDRKAHDAHNNGDQKAVPAQPAPVFLMYLVREWVRAVERMRQDKGALSPRLFNVFHLTKSVIGEAEEGSDARFVPDATSIPGTCDRCGHGETVRDAALTTASNGHVRSLRFKLCDFCVSVYEKMVSPEVIA